LGLSNAPDTDYENYGRREALLRLKAQDKVLVARQNTIGGPFVYVQPFGVRGPREEMMMQRVVRRFGTKAAAHHQTEAAMITNNGTHVFVRKGYEYSTWAGILGGPLLLWLGLSNAPDTDYENYGRREALLRLKAQDKVLVARQNTIGGPFVYV
ncbi:hypothetical protein THRCLA_20078, partial [Thraustotheca clavata]